jgi:hypothetical protein
VQSAAPDVVVASTPLQGAALAAALMFAQVGGIVVGMTVQHSDAEQPAAEHVISVGVALMPLVSEAQSKVCTATVAAQVGSLFR